VRRSVPTELEEAVAELDAAGAGWVNVGPDIDEDDLPPPSGGLGKLFGGRGPAVPHATWVAGAARRGGQRPSELGIEHGSGPKAVARLKEAGLDLPAGWLVRQDHVRRGLVLAVPPGTPAEEIVGFLLGAAARLAQVPVGDRWLADVHAG
jgi:hypothetical protein